MIAEVEFFVLDDDQLDAGYSLYDIEMASESISDYFSYFVKDNGVVITKFDVERKLNNIKSWIYARVREKSTSRRFQRFR